MFMLLIWLYLSFIYLSLAVDLLKWLSRQKISCGVLSSLDELKS